MIAAEWNERVAAFGFPKREAPPKAYCPTDFSEAYALTAAERRALPKEQIRQLNVKAGLLVARGLAAAHNFDEWRDAMAQLPVDLRRVDQVGTYARAFSHADALACTSFEVVLPDFVEPGETIVLTAQQRLQRLIALTRAWGIRALLGYDRQLCAATLAASVKVCSRSLKPRAKARLALSSIRHALTGAVAAIQRTDSGPRFQQQSDSTSIYTSWCSTAFTSVTPPTMNKPPIMWTVGSAKPASTFRKHENPAAKAQVKRPEADEVHAVAVEGEEQGGAYQYADDEQQGEITDESLPDPRAGVNSGAALARVCRIAATNFGKRTHPRRCRKTSAVKRKTAGCFVVTAARVQLNNIGHERSDARGCIGA